MYNLYTNFIDNILIDAQVHFLPKAWWLKVLLGIANNSIKY